MECSFLTMGVPVLQPRLCTSRLPPSSSSLARISPTQPSVTTTTLDRTPWRNLCSLSVLTAQDRPADSILHARRHSSQQVCRHRITGQQLSEHPAADAVLVPLTRPVSKPATRILSFQSEIEIRRTINCPPPDPTNLPTNQPLTVRLT